MTIELMIAVPLFALAATGRYFIFRKMGIPGWKSLIPIYTDYLLFRELIGEGYFWGYVTSSLSAVICSTLVIIGVLSRPMEIPFVIAAILACTITIAIQIKLLHSLAKSFGHGVGYTFGLVVVEPIMLMILGLEQNRYARAAA